MNRDNAPREREMVYCHECENEWYRDEHGLVCPDCQSDFTQIIEANNDPRVDDAPLSPLGHAGESHEWYASDPDEDDIDHVEWMNHRQGQHPGQNVQGDYSRGQGEQSDRQSPMQGQAGGLVGLLGNVFGGGLQQQQQQQERPPPWVQYQGQQQQQQGYHGQQHQHHHPYPYMHNDQRPQPPPQQHGHPPPWMQHGEGLRSASGSPGSSTIIRHSSGPNFSVTFTTTTHNLNPRNANGPQALQNQPTSIEQLLNQVFMNIGAVPPGAAGGGPRPDRPLFMEMGGAHRAFNPGATPRPAGGFPFSDFLSFLLPPGGVHGDAVYSQDAFDRVITQLMEQHQAGNAPGPATEDAINGLPTKKISSQDQADSGKAECSICMDEVALNATVTVLPCDHWFHHECIKAWLSEHDTCPHCRRGIMPKDEPDTSRPRQPSQTPLNDMHAPEFQYPHTPGEFPTSRRTSHGSPTSPRSPHRSTGGGASGMFNRMREAFGSGGSGSNDANRQR